MTGLGDKCFRIALKAHTMKERTNKHEFMKIRNITAKDSVRRMNKNTCQR